MAQKTNSAAGGSHGTAVTTGNSGGASGTAFDSVSGTITYDNTHPRGGAGLGFKSVISTSQLAYGAWSVAGSNGQTHYLRFYYYAATVNAPINFRLARVYNSGTSVLEVRHNTAGQIDVFDAVAAQICISGNVTAATLYRVEVRFTVTAGATSQAELRVYAGDATTETLSTPVTSTSTRTIGAFTEVRFGLSQSTNGTGTAYVDEVGWSDTTWLGVPAASQDESGTGTIAAAGALTASGGRGAAGNGYLDFIGTLTSSGVENPPILVWSLWDGVDEHPLTLDGIWNGASILTPSTVEIVP